jgi:hypothetical protein
MNFRLGIDSSDRFPASRDRGQQRAALLAPLMAPTLTP